MNTSAGPFLKYQVVNSNMKRLVTLIVGVLLLVASLALVGVVAGSDVISIDDDHELNSDGSIEQYEAEGLATAEVDRIQLEMTLAEDPEDVGLDGWKYSLGAGSGNEYLRLQYDESIDRTVRIELDEELVTPRTKHGVESVEGDVVADIYPSSDGESTIIKVELEGDSDVVIPLNKAEGWLFDIRGSASESVESVSGYELSSNPFASEDWEYVDPDALSDSDSTYMVESERATIQYNGADVDSEDDVWLTVPECNNPAEQAVCSYEKDGEIGTYVMSTQDEPPQIRYKDGYSISDSVSASINELHQIFGNIQDRVSSIFN